MASPNSKSNLVRIHSGAPENESVRFGFGRYADTLAGLIANKKNENPLIKSIYGHWGSGQTTLPRAIKKRLDGSLQTALLTKRLDASAEEIRDWF